MKDVETQPFAIRSGRQGEPGTTRTRLAVARVRNSASNALFSLRS